MWSVLSLTVLVLATAPIIYYALAIYCLVDFYRAERTHKRAAPRGFCPPVSILKPVRGVDHDAYGNFASFCRLDYQRYELLFGVADDSDPVIKIIQQLQQDFPERRIRLITPIPQIGANRKVSVLFRLAGEAAHDLLVMTDSDVRVSPDYLQSVAAPFGAEGVGGVTCLYRSVAPRSLAGRLNGLGMAMESSPAAIVAHKLEGNTEFAFGWTMATTKKHLGEIGGWESMANVHSDDFELGNRLARAGYKVELLAEPVEMVFPRENLKDLLSHELRWAIGLRNVRPIAYWGMLLTHGLPWSLAAAAVILRNHWSAVWAVAYLLGYLALRLGATWVAGVWGLGDSFVRRNLWLAPLRDAITFGVWVAGCFCNEIRWRGAVYRVEDRLLLPVRAIQPSQD